MRRSDKEITDAGEIDDILSTAMIGRLGTSHNDAPYITPVNFAHSDGRIFLHSANSGHKLDNINANPNVCFEVEDVEGPVIKMPICASTATYRSVIIFGTIRVIHDNVSKSRALTVLVEKYTGAPFVESFTAAMLGRVTVLEITIERMTAKRSPAG